MLQIIIEKNRTQNTNQIEKNYLFKKKEQKGVLPAVEKKRKKRYCFCWKERV